MFTVVQGFFNIVCDGSVGEELLCLEDMIESVVVYTADGREVKFECMDIIPTKVSEVEYDDVDDEKVFKDDLNIIYDECTSIIDCDMIKLGDVLYSTIFLGNDVVMKNNETGEVKVSVVNEIESMLSDEGILIKMYRLRKL